MLKQAIRMPLAKSDSSFNFGFWSNILHLNEECSKSEDSLFNVFLSTRMHFQIQNKISLNQFYALKTLQKILGMALSSH